MCLIIFALDCHPDYRLILCDALHFAQKYRPATMIDLATLTGACVVALGHEASGLMGNDPRLVYARK